VLVSELRKGLNVLNRCEIVQDGIEFYVHFMIGSFHDHTDEFNHGTEDENYDSAQKKIKEWLKKPKVSGF
jgi:hypothetical protein